MKSGIDYIGVGVGAMIVNDENKVLLLLRSANSKNEPGKWNFPGGEVEFGETLEAAVKREVMEEVGLEVEVEKLLKVIDHIIADENQHWCNPIFKVKHIKGKPEIKEPRKVEKLAWFSLEELPENLTCNLVDLFGDINKGRIDV